MARKHFARYEAISSAVPVEDAYEPVIAIKRRGTDEKARIHAISTGKHYHFASEADAIAEAALTKVMEVSDTGELIFEPNAL